MVKYNRGRFIFKFSPEDKNLCAVFDSKYEAEYAIGHIAFEQVFEMAVKSLDDESAKELEKSLKGEFMDKLENYIRLKFKKLVI